MEKPRVLGLPIETRPIYPLVFWEKQDKEKVGEMVEKWHDKAAGYFDSNPDQVVITLYSGENDSREPVAFIFEENDVLKIIVVGKTPALAEEHFQTITNKNNLDLGKNF